MDTSVLLRPAMCVIGGAIMAAGFLCLSQKKMTVNLALVAEFLGAALIVTGAVPAFSAWTKLLSMGTGTALLAIGAVGVLGAFQVALLISKLLMRQEELAVQVSLLLEENRRLDKRLGEIEAHEKDFVGDQFTEPGGGGDSPFEPDKGTGQGR